MITLLIYLLIAYILGDFVVPFVRMFLERTRSPRWGFGIEQILHGSLIGWVISWYNPIPVDPGFLNLSNPDQFEQHKLWLH